MNENSEFDMKRMNGLFDKVERALDAYADLIVNVNRVVVRIGQQAEDAMTFEMDRRVRRATDEDEAEPIRLANEKRGEELRARELLLREQEQALKEKAFESNKKLIDKKIASGEKVASYEI